MLHTPELRKHWVVTVALAIRKHNEGLQDSHSIGVTVDQVSWCLLTMDKLWMTYGCIYRRLEKLVELDYLSKIKYGRRIAYNVSDKAKERWPEAAERT